MTSYRNIALIPARSKSKRLKDKNIKKIHGIPLIGHAVNQAKDTGLFDEIIVSTDSFNYAQIAERYGAKTLELRPNELSRDDTSSWDVARNVIQNLRRHNKEFDYLVLLQPTSPLRKSHQITEALDIAHKNELDYLASVNKTEIKPYHINNLSKDKSLFEFIHKPNKFIDNGSYYKLNGAIYIVKVDCLINDHFINSKRSQAYIMPEIDSIDIDTKLDFEIAKFIYNKRIKSGAKNAKKY